MTGSSEAVAGARCPSGPAAIAFNQGWDDWKRSAQEVLDGLVAMADLLDATHADLTETDLVIDTGIDRLTARLG